MPRNVTLRRPGSSTADAAPSAGNPDPESPTGRRLVPHPVENQALKDAVALVFSGADLR